MRDAFVLKLAGFPQSSLALLGFIVTALIFSIPEAYAQGISYRRLAMAV